MDRIFKGLGRRLLRRLMFRGMNAGISHMANPDGKPRSPQERQRTRAAKQITKRARKGARLVRHLGRF